MILNSKTSTRTLLLGALFAFTVFSIGCTKRPNPEELQLLDAQIQAADDAEARVSELESEKSSLESKLESEKKKLSDLEVEFEEIKRRKGE